MSSSATLSSQLIAGISIPKISAITAAIDYLRAHSSDFTYNHSMRTLLFGFAIASKLPNLQSRDIEAHAVAAILHDLGWDNTGKLISKDKQFEVDEADAARAFLRTLKGSTGGSEWNERRLQLVWDAITLHTTFSIVRYKEPEVVACWMGILADFTGPDGSPERALTWAEYEGIVEVYPRLKLVTGIKEFFADLARRNQRRLMIIWWGVVGKSMLKGIRCRKRWICLRRVHCRILLDGQLWCSWFAYRSGLNSIRIVCFF
jgi:hypothetical protein